MASAEAVKRMESRAAAAEQLIAILRAQINEIRVVSESKPTFEQEMASLRKENSALKGQIDEWKAKLTTVESEHGVPQVNSPANANGHEKVAQTPTTPAAVVVGNQTKEGEASKSTPAEKSGKKKGGKGGGGGGGGDKKDEGPVDVGRLDMRVGLITTAKRHPDADSLYIEEIDVGEEKPRQVISGLVKFVPIEEMQNRKAIILCNLKPSKMRGIVSEAMVMCASTPERVEILMPPEGSKPGDVVTVEGFERNPDAQLNPKKKIFETCAPDLKVDGNGVAVYKGSPWAVNGKPCKAASLTGVQVK